MPDTPIEPIDRDPHDPGLEVRVTRLEGDMREVKGTLGQMVPVLTRIDATLTSTLPHLATKAELADLRSELTSALAATRPETASAISEMRLEAANSRSELLGMIGELRSDAANTRSELVGMIAELRAMVAEKPSKTYLWAVLGVLVAAMVASYGAGLAAIALR